VPETTRVDGGTKNATNPILTESTKSKSCPAISSLPTYGHDGHDIRTYRI